MKLSKSMKILALALGVFGSLVQAYDDHPIGKVITLLKGLSLKSEMEGKAEAVSYDKFVHWCSVSTATLESAITEEKETIDSLTSQVASEENAIETLKEKIAGLEKEIADMALAQNASDELRKSGRKLFEESQADLNSTIFAVGSALAGLVASDTPDLVQVLSVPRLRRAIALASVSERPFGGSASKSLALASVLLQQHGQEVRPQLKAEGDRTAHVKPYNFKSGDVVELLKELKRKFEDELLGATKAETNAENSYAMEKQARLAASQAAKAAKDDKTSTLGDVSADLAEHKEDLETTQGELAADSASLSQTSTACIEKQQEWEARSKVRTQEIEAIGSAIEILSKSTGVRTEAPSNPILPPPPTDAMLQISASFLQILEDPTERAIALLRSRARASHSRRLARLAQELAAHMGDPFGKVGNMIEKMIFRLMSEQTDEDNHKKWCDQELSSTNASKANKEDKVFELSSKIEKAETLIQELAVQVKEETEMVAKITKFSAEATEIRQVQKKENAEALKDAQDAQSSIAEAIAVLEAFYKESGMVKKESWEFLQHRSSGVELPASPMTWSSSYTGVADPKHPEYGIIAVLEETASKFATMEAETRAQEAEDQKAFDEQMQESAIDKAQRQKEAEMKEQEKKRLTEKSRALQDTKKHIASELEAVDQYLKDLAPACLEADSTYEDRKGARAAEIGALKEAEKILGNAFVAAPPQPAPVSKLLVHRHRQLRGH